MAATEAAAAGSVAVATEVVVVAVTVVAIVAATSESGPGSAAAAAVVAAVAVAAKALNPVEGARILLSALAGLRYGVYLLEPLGTNRDSAPRYLGFLCLETL